MSNNPAEGEPRPHMDLNISDFDNLKDKYSVEKAFEIDLKWKLFQGRYEYAWSYFDFHASQRTTMFNFFMLFAGLALTAWATLMDKDLNAYVLAALIAIVGMFISLIFVALERRNEELVHIAEAVLESLEGDVLFHGYHREIRSPMRRDFTIFGKIRCGKQLREVSILRRQSQENSAVGESNYSHGKWMPIIQFIMAGTFLILFLYSLGFAIYNYWPVLMAAIGK